MKVSTWRWPVLGAVCLTAAMVALHGASADLPVMDGVPDGRARSGRHVL